MQGILIQGSQVIAVQYARRIFAHEFKLMTREYKDLMIAGD
jgi:hypothetical protein